MAARRAVREVDTPVGIARAHLLRPPHPRGSLVLGHGAGGGIEAPDLQALTALADDGWVVVLVEQPWRVAGRRLATPPAQLDVAWRALLEALTRGRGALPRPLVVGGRSAGARVACRTAAAVGADAVLTLAFPLHPPGRPEKSRAAEALEVIGAAIPLAVIQGEKDAFGTPAEVAAALGAPGTVAAVQGAPGALGAPGAAARVLAARGTHSFTKAPGDVLALARTWLDEVLPETGE